MVIRDYAKIERTEIPFPYFAEVMTCFEHSSAALMLYAVWLKKTWSAFAISESRYGGEKGNPWDEAKLSVTLKT